MKNLSFIFALTLITSLLIGFSACKKDASPTVYELLEGRWKCISWTADTTELIGLAIYYSILDYEKPDGDDGEYEWVVKDTDGQLEILDGIYSIDADQSKIKFTPTTFPMGGSGFFEMKFSVTADKLVLEGFNAGYYQKITFQKD